MTAQTTLESYQSNRTITNSISRHLPSRLRSPLAGLTARYFAPCSLPGLPAGLLPRGAADAARLGISAVGSLRLL
jgi:hypothetical protein